MTANTTRACVVLVAAAAYAVIGLTTAAFAQAGAASAWRLAAWLLSGMVFAGQVLYTKLLRRDSSLSVAIQVAAAAAVGALLLAAGGPVRSHWSSGDLGRTALLSLAVWPMITALPAFLIALGLAMLLERWVVRDKPAVPPRVA